MKDLREDAEVRRWVAEQRRGRLRRSSSPLRVLSRLGIDVIPSDEIDPGKALLSFLGKLRQAIA